MLVQGESSHGTMLALQGPEEGKTTGKRNQILVWEGPTTTRKKGGRSSRGIHGKWAGVWMKAPGGRAGQVPDFLFPFLPNIPDCTPHISSLLPQPTPANIAATEFTRGDASFAPAGGEGEGLFHHTTVRGSELGTCFWQWS